MIGAALLLSLFISVAYSFCAGKSDGFHCDASSVNLLSCAGGQDTVIPCESGCSVQPPGVPDFCTGSKAGFITKAGRFPIEDLDKTPLFRARGYSMGSHQVPVNKFLLHTIEGSAKNGDYEAGTNALDQEGYWPHFILALDRAGNMRIGQYLPLSITARALVSPANSLGCIQVEIGALADNPFTEDGYQQHAIFTEAVAALFAAVRGYYPAVLNRVDSRVRFAGSGSYGKNASQRLSQADFISVSGLVGHQHAPNNDHWDPGAINATKLLNGGAPITPTSPSPPPPDWCSSGKSDGWYCRDNKVLIECQGGSTFKLTDCPGSGCVVKPPGVPDVCDTPAPVPLAIPTPAPQPIPTTAAFNCAALSSMGCEKCITSSNSVCKWCNANNECMTYEKPCGGSIRVVESCACSKTTSCDACIKIAPAGTCKFCIDGGNAKCLAARLACTEVVDMPTRCATTTKPGATTAMVTVGFCSSRGSGLFCDGMRVVQCNSVYVASVTCKVGCVEKTPGQATCEVDTCVGLDDGPHCDSGYSYVSCSGGKVISSGDCQTSCQYGACTKLEPCKGKPDGFVCATFAERHDCRQGKSIWSEKCAFGCSSSNYGLKGVCRGQSGGSICMPGTRSCNCLENGGCDPTQPNLQTTTDGGGNCVCYDPAIDAKCPGVQPLLCDGALIHPTDPKCVVPEKCPDVPKIDCEGRKLGDPCVSDPKIDSRGGPYSGSIVACIKNNCTCNKPYITDQIQSTCNATTLLAVIGIQGDTPAAKLCSLATAHYLCSVNIITPQCIDDYELCTVSTVSFLEKVNCPVCLGVVNPVASASVNAPFCVLLASVVIARIL